MLETALCFEEIIILLKSEHWTIEVPV